MERAGGHTVPYGGTTRVIYIRTRL